MIYISVAMSSVRGAPAPGTHPAAPLTEAAVVLPGAVHRAVGEDLQVEAGAAVELPPPQDALEVSEVGGGAPLQPPLDLPQALVEEAGGVGEGQPAAQRGGEAVQVRVQSAQETAHLGHGAAARGRARRGAERPLRARAAAARPRAAGPGPAPRCPRLP